MKWEVAAYARIRPPPAYSSENVHCSVIEMRNGRKQLDELQFVLPEDADFSLTHGNSDTVSFLFDKVFGPEASQAEVFEEVVHETAAAAVDGINGTVFAYGQTGSGKTYTICGGGDYDDRGMIPRAITSVFQAINRKPGWRYRIHVTFSEIYNEVLYDLLDPGQKDRPIEQWTKVQLLEGEEGDLHVRNLRVFEVQNEEAALSLLFLGATNRQTSATLSNDASSRSHAIFTLTIQGEGIVQSKLLRTCGKLNLVDLAGSERLRRSDDADFTIRESRGINLSLHYLEQVVVSLLQQTGRKKKQGHIPYRNSVMTSLLRDSLGGNCRTSFVMTVSIERRHFEETLSTCRFAQRCAQLTMELKGNEEFDLRDQLLEEKQKTAVLQRRLQGAQHEIMDLMERVKLIDLEITRAQQRADPNRDLSNAEQLEMQQLAEALVRADGEALQAMRTLDMSQAMACCLQLRDFAERAIDNETAARAENQMLNRKVEGLQGDLDAATKSAEDAASALLAAQAAAAEQQRKAEADSAATSTVEDHSTADHGSVDGKIHRTGSASSSRNGADDGHHLGFRAPFNSPIFTRLTPAELNAMLTTGDYFLKHKRHGGSHQRFVWLNEDLSEIRWAKDHARSVLDWIALASFERIEVGSNGGGWGRRSGNPHIITLVGGKGGRNLVLETMSDAEDPKQVTHAWAHGLAYAIHKAKGFPMFVV